MIYSDNELLIDFGKMMGNENSGRRKTGKAHLGQLLAFSAKDLKPYLGYAGAVQTLSWTNGTQIGVAFYEKKLITKCCTENGDPILQEILLTSTKCNFGNSRTWLVCGCGKRVGTLYMGTGKQFICRACTGLNYRSQALGAVDRGALTLRRLKAKLDPKGKYDFEVIPKKPKGMHISTYQQVEARIQIAYDKRAAAMGKKWGMVLERLRGRVNALSDKKSASP